MDLLRYIFQLGITFIVFNLIWKGLLLSIWTVLKGPIKANVWNYTLKFSDRYFIASLAAIVTLSQLTASLHSWQGYLFTVAGAAALFFYLAGRMGNKTMSVQINGRVVRFGEPPELRYEVRWALVAVSIFVAGVFWPPLVQNPISEWLIAAIEEIYSWPIIGWIIGLLGIIFSIRFIFRGISLLSSWLRPEKQAEGPTTEDVEYVDYEEVGDDEEGESPKRIA